jgi:hypothetical protein
MSSAPPSLPHGLHLHLAYRELGHLMRPAHTRPGGPPSPPLRRAERSPACSETGACGCCATAEFHRPTYEHVLHARGDRRHAGRVNPAGRTGRAAGAGDRTRWRGQTRSPLDCAYCDARRTALAGTRGRPTAQDDLTSPRVAGWYGCGGVRASGAMGTTAAGGGEAERRQPARPGAGTMMRSSITT